MNTTYIHMCLCMFIRSPCGCKHLQSYCAHVQGCSITVEESPEIHDPLGQMHVRTRSSKAATGDKGARMDIQNNPTKEED